MRVSGGFVRRAAAMAVVPGGEAVYVNGNAPASPGVPMPERPEGPAARPESRTDWGRTFLEPGRPRIREQHLEPMRVCRTDRSWVNAAATPWRPVYGEVRPTTTADAGPSVDEGGPLPVVTTR